MRNRRKFLGIGLILAGALTLTGSYLAGLSNVNALLFTGLFLIAAGIVAHVAALKKESDY